MSWQGVAVKYAIIIPDGAADQRAGEPPRTPLELADTPSVDWLASNGRCGTVALCPPRAPFDMAAAVGAMFGCDPAECALAAGPMEAAGLGLHVDATDWVFCCSLVTVVDGVLIDPTAEGVSTREAAQLIDELNEALGGAKVRLLCGRGWRHLMISEEEIKVRTVPPHSVVGQAVANAAPRGRGRQQLKIILQTARELLADHEINAVRRELGESPVTDIWLWGAGQARALPAFEERFGLTGAIVAGDPLVRGLAGLIGWQTADTAAGGAHDDADLGEMGCAAADLLDEFDIVCVHTSAADRAGMAGDPAGKVAAIEAIDKHIVGPVLRRLRDEGESWRMLVAPTHATPCEHRRRTAEPVPFAIGGLGAEALIRQPYCEETAESSDLHIRRGHELMEYFLTVR